MRMHVLSYRWSVVDEQQSGRATVRPTAEAVCRTARLRADMVLRVVTSGAANIVLEPLNERGENIWLTQHLNTGTAI